MLESDISYQDDLVRAIHPLFRDRLLDRGIARGLIWEDGELPESAPRFSPDLTDDLLDYGYGIMSMALQIRTLRNDDATAKNAFLVAGECIQAAVHKADQDQEDNGFHRVNAAVAFHLAGYPTLAFSIVPDEVTSANLSPTEHILVLLFRRKIRELRDVMAAWLRNDANADGGVADRLTVDDDFNAVDAANTLITTSFMRSIALFDFAIKVGHADYARAAADQLNATADIASGTGLVNHWWTLTLASHIVRDLWDMSLHNTIPLSPTDDPDRTSWDDLRERFIRKMNSGDFPVVSLWPSQIEAASRASELKDDLVVALPTSSGKTRVAEICILRTLASSRRIIYVTPLRALSAQIERELAETFTPLGFVVSSLYDSVDIDSGDGETLRQGHVVVSTPEKLNFALRNDPTLIDDVGLIVLDEGHMLGPREREVRYEILIENLRKREDAADRRIVTLSALFPPPDQMDEFVSWIRRDPLGSSVYSNWRPTRQRFGTIVWRDDVARLDLAVEGQESYIARFIEQTPPPSNSRRINQFPNNKNELTLQAAWQFIAQKRQVFIFSPLRRSVDSLGKLVLDTIGRDLLHTLKTPSPATMEAINTGIEWLGADHPAVNCLRHGVVLHHGGFCRGNI